MEPQVVSNLWIAFGGAIWGAVCFVVGVLVFRNNSKLLEGIIDEIDPTLDSLRDSIGEEIEEKMRDLKEEIKLVVEKIKN